jgi:hypothetical protein
MGKKPNYKVDEQDEQIKIDIAIKLYFAAMIILTIDFRDFSLIGMIRYIAAFLFISLIFYLIVALPYRIKFGHHPWSKNALK